METVTAPTAMTLTVSNSGPDPRSSPPGCQPSRYNQTQELRRYAKPSTELQDLLNPPLRPIRGHPLQLDVEGLPTERVHSHCLESSAPTEGLLLGGRAASSGDRCWCFLSMRRADIWEPFPCRHWVDFQHRRNSYTTLPGHPDLPNIHSFPHRLLHLSVRPSFFFPELCELQPSHLFIPLYVSVPFLKIKGLFYVIRVQ